MKSYKKFREYKITLASVSEDEFTRFLYDPRLNDICVCNDHYVANMRFRKNLNRPNRVRNVKYTVECWNRHLQKKKKGVDINPYCDIIMPRGERNENSDLPQVRLPHH